MVEWLAGQSEELGAMILIQGHFFCHEFYLLSSGFEEPG
jgi:hypothetical protein